MLHVSAYHLAECDESNEGSGRYETQGELERLLRRREGGMRSITHKCTCVCVCVCACACVCV